MTLRICWVAAVAVGDWHLFVLPILNHTSFYHQSMQRLAQHGRLFDYTSYIEMHFCL
jgi:hypothetical protein